MLTALLCRYLCPPRLRKRLHTLSSLLFAELSPLFFCGCRVFVSSHSTQYNTSLESKEAVINTLLACDYASLELYFVDENNNTGGRSKGPDKRD